MQKFVGGHVDHTVVGASGVVSRQIHKFDDKVGEKLGACDEPNFLAMPVGNRQRRRAAERVVMKLA